ncbi:MAG: murein L,D-transpeptidase catalytic domain family protein [Bdellovibrionota bacterium]
MLALTLTIFFSSLLLAAPEEKTPIEMQTIKIGINAGKTLLEIVESYRFGKEGALERIPKPAIDQTFQFYNQYSETRRNYTYFPLEKMKSNPNLEEFAPFGLATAETTTIGNHNYVVIFDLNLHSSLPRLHIIDLTTGEIESVQAAHGADTDCGGERLGYTCRFSNGQSGKASPLGFFSTGALYNGSEGWTIRLNGLEDPSPGFTGNTNPTTIVMHAAWYVLPGHTGRSHGCPAVMPSVIEKWKDKIKDGALFYFYHQSLDIPTRLPKVTVLSK